MKENQTLEKASLCKSNTAYLKHENNCNLIGK